MTGPIECPGCGRERVTGLRSSLLDAQCTACGQTWSKLEDDWPFGEDEL